MQKVENAGQRCHFRRRCNSLPAGNFRSQRWIRKHSAATSVLALLLLHTSAFPTRYATETYVHVYLAKHTYVHLAMRKGIVSSHSLKENAVHGSLELISYLHDLLYGSLHAHCCRNYTYSYACL